MSYWQHCPVMSRLSSTLADGNESAIPESIRKQCPFLSKEQDSMKDAVKEASSAVEEDIINLDSNNVDKTTFPYEDFFHNQIMKKKKDHSYRYQQN